MKKFEVGQVFFSKAMGQYVLILERNINLVEPSFRCLQDKLLHDQIVGYSLNNKEIRIWSVGWFTTQITLKI